MKKRRTARNILIALIPIFIIILGFSFFSGFRADIPPFSNKLDLVQPALSVACLDDGYYVLDDSSMRVVYVKNGVLQWQINSDGDTFSKAQSIASDDSGNLYVHDIQYDDQGVLIKKERVLRYNISGEFEKEIYSVEYHKVEDRPANVGKIASVKFVNGNIVILTRLDDAILMLINRANGLKGEERFVSEGIGSRALAMTVDSENRIYYTAKSGGIYRVDKEGETLIYMPAQTTDERMDTIAYMLDIDENGDIYFTDIGLRRILCLPYNKNAADGESLYQQVRVVVGNEGDDAEGINNSLLRYPISASYGKLITSDAESVECFTPQGESAGSFMSVELSGAQITIQWLGWCGLIGLGILALIALVLLPIRLIKRAEGITFKLGLLSLVIVLATTAVIAYIMLSDTGENIDDEFRKNITYLGQLISEGIDGDALREIDSLADIEGETYAELKEQMTTYIDAAYETDYGLYYLLYRRIAGVTCVVMDAENQFPCVYPQYIDEDLDQLIYADKEHAVTTNYRDASGIWAFCVYPIFDSDDEVAGVLELGINMYSMQQKRDSQTLEMLLTVAVIAVLVLLLLGEGIVFAEARGKRSLANGDGSELMLRLVMFLLMAAQSMQDSFIPVLAKDMYIPLPGIPDGIGATLPITLEMFMVAVVATIGGSILARISLHKALRGGLIVAIGGFAVSMLASDFYMLLLGKAIIGIGVGFSYITLNTMAANQSTPERSERLFSQLNAGMLAGTQTGIIVGAYLYAAASYTGAYAASVLFAVIALVIALTCVTRAMGFVAPNDDETKSISGVRFLFKRRTWSFILLALIPSLIAISFFEYYFPLFGTDNGLSEERIGQIMLLNGLCAIYAGPALTRKLLKKLGARMTTVLAGALFALTLLVFAVAPGIPGMLFLVCAFGLITGFSYSAQEAYFNRIEGISEYGTGRAMSMYSLFQGIAQAFAPVLIAAALLAGDSQGSYYLVYGLVATTLLFFLLSVKKRQQK